MKIHFTFSRVKDTEKENKAALLSLISNHQQQLGGMGRKAMFNMFLSTGEITGLLFPADLFGGFMSFVICLEQCCWRTAGGNGLPCTSPGCADVQYFRVADVAGIPGEGCRLPEQHLGNTVYSAPTATSEKYFQPCHLTPENTVEIPWKLKFC